MFDLSDIPFPKPFPAHRTTPVPSPSMPRCGHHLTSFITMSTASSSFHGSQVSLWPPYLPGDTLVIRGPDVTTVTTQDIPNTCFASISTINHTVKEGSSERFTTSTRGVCGLVWFWLRSATTWHPPSNAICNVRGWHGVLLMKK